jgi:hypothetical protein
MDGNNSVKRIASSGKTDQRDLPESYYFISSEQVNLYANEVPRPPSHHNEEEDKSDPEEELPDFDQEGGDPTDGGVISGCAGHWKAAEADHKKKMWQVFDETGMFASACRHGMILWIADMVRSGEL